MATLIKRGAEAEIYLSEWMGRKVIVKKRIRKKYRIKEIDDELRKRRTKKEGVLMAGARKAGVAVPVIYDVDMDGMKITMQYVDGKSLKDCLDEMDIDEQKNVCRKIGESIAFLHKNGIVHGDITTSNLILYGDNVYFIDFGLGEKSSEDEKRGVDLHLLRGAFKAAHKNSNLFEWVFESYRRNYHGADSITKKMEEIAGRGRYVVRG